MKIAVVGCGALGCYYGAHFLKTGAEVHFLLRSDYGAVIKNGVSIRSERGDFNVRPRCARDPESIGICDVVFIGLKTTANIHFSTLLVPLVGRNTIVVTLQNGLGNEEALSSIVSSDMILGGLCFVCLNRVEPGVVLHLGYGEVVLGEFQGEPRPRTYEMAKLFETGGISCQVTANLDQAHWEKLAWNIPFNGLGVAGVAGIDALMSGHLPSDWQRGSTLSADQLLADPKWLNLARELMGEIVASGRGYGFPMSFSLVDTLITRTLAMGSYKASSLIDFERGEEIELESMFLKPLERAQAMAIPTPRLSALCQILSELEESR